MATAALAGLAAGTGTSAGADGRPPAGTAADASATSATSAASDTSDTNIDVTDYDVTMSYQPDSRELRGAAVVSVRATEALDRFTLHLGELTVRSVTVDSEAVRSFSRTGEKDLVIVPAAAIARDAEFQVRVEYDGIPGAGWFPTTSGGATAFQGNSSAWFPAHEDANDKAAFHLTATVPAPWSVVSIGREGQEGRESTPTNTTNTTSTTSTTTFRWTAADVDPANIAVSVDRFTMERSALADGTPVVNAYAPGLEETTAPLADRLPEILDFLSGTFGPYPFQAAGNVFVHVNDDGPATAPQTRPVYLGAGNAQYMNLNAIVHEQAHQWYGVSAAPRQSEDNCLSECFAVYATWLWDEAKDGADLDARYREQVNAHLDDAGFWQELYRPGETPGFSMYDKGPLALHALRRQVGDQAFHRLLKQWPREHRGDYAGWPQFAQFAEQLTGQDLTGFFQAWFLDATVPADEYLWPGGLKP